MNQHEINAIINEKINTIINSAKPSALAKVMADGFREMYDWRGRLREAFLGKL